MGDDFIPAINRLVDDIARQEAQIAEMKRTVNRLCGYANLSAKYPQIDDPTVANRGLQIKPGQFYRKPLATAVGDFLKARGNPGSGGLGPATLDSIYDALREGGFEFEAKSDVTAKRSLAISLAKNSQTFEKLPTGEFGLTIWYSRRDTG